MQTRYDVIVIGSGISGLNFALRAAEQSAHVLVITKKRVANSGTNAAQGGIAAVLSQLDDFRRHVEDTMKAGAYHNNRRAVEYMVKHGPAAVKRLIALGVPFAEKNGKLELAREGGHTKRRIAFVSDYTGRAIEQILVKRAAAQKNITLMENTFASDLLVKNGICYGAAALKNKRFTNIYGGITVLATGGAGQIYENTTNPAISTGDGLATAARAGARFRDLEFIQFHPTALKVKGGPRFLISEAVRGEGALLRNSELARFMKKIHPLAELAPRDIVSRAIFEEEKSGPVYLDLRHKKASYLRKRFPQIYAKLLKFGIHMACDLIPVSPAAHYICGGVKVNLKGETGIKNLYAFGEVAGTGVHGANRLASNSLLEALVFSDRILAKKTHKNTAHPNFKIPALRVTDKKDKKTINKLRNSLRRVMWKNVGIIRSHKSLKEAIKTFNLLEREYEAIKSNDEQSLEFKNMLTAAKLIAASALKRKKSLGCHSLRHQAEYL